MAVNVPSQGTYLQTLGSHITNLRDAYQIVLNDNSYLTAMGGAMFLETAPPGGFGMDSADSSAVVAALGNLAGSNLGAALTNSETLWGGG